MYYQTRIETVGNGGAIDIQGRKLAFIGNLLIKAGDFVWTDGKVIFGHNFINDQPLITFNGSGIPVLGENLRGYFKSNGNFKEYPVFEDSYIVNSRRIFKHGDETLDAEICLENENEILYTANESEEYFVSAGEVIADGEIIILKNDQEIERLRLKDYAKSEDKIREIFPILNSPDSDTSSIASNFEVISKVENFKFKINGEYEALISTTAHSKMEETTLNFETYSRQKFIETTFPFEYEGERYDQFKALLKQNLNQMTDAKKAIEKTVEMLGKPTEDERLKEALMLFWDYCLGEEQNNYQVETYLHDKFNYNDESIYLASSKYVTRVKSDKTEEILQELLDKRKMKYNEIDTYDKINGWYYSLGINEDGTLYLASFPRVVDLNPDYVRQEGWEVDPENPYPTEEEIDYIMHRTSVELGKAVGYVLLLDKDRFDYLPSKVFTDGYFENAHFIVLIDTRYKEKGLIPSPAMICLKLPVSFGLYNHWEADLKSFMYVFFDESPSERFFEIYSENDELTHHFYFQTGDKIVPVCLLKTSNKFCYLSCLLSRFDGQIIYDKIRERGR